MKKITVDGNHAAAYVSYAFSELAVIYPITPSSPMSELADEWATSGKKNLFGQTPKVVQMQSEAGVAGALHGALSCGALATTYTCSQGLLLMQPNLFKIAGELLPSVVHVSARAIATHALNIFGDHQDVMACRQTGVAMLCSSSVQEVMDLSIVAHLATLKSSVPFLHFFDGFRTSHEICKIEAPDYEELKPLVNEQDIEKFRARALDPNSPKQCGTAQNSDIYFQNRERANPYYLALPKIVQEKMNEVASLTGRSYHLFDYFGVEDAERVLVIMGSGASTAEETLHALNEEGERVGLVKVRLYRPFDSQAFCDCLPKTCKKIAVLDRTKESGSVGEPLYLDVLAALKECGREEIVAVGGRYGLGMKEFTPDMCRAVYENLRLETPKNRFTVGIEDDVSGTSLKVEKKGLSKNEKQTACRFYGLGSDGTVGANKNSVKIIGEHTDLYVQGYFYYDSKKSGGVTVSHLRFGGKPILSAYLVEEADFVACHNPSYLTRYDMLSGLKENGTFLLNCPKTDIESLNSYLSAPVKQKIAEKKIRFYVIDGTKIAEEVGLKGRTSTVMQTAFFLLNPQIMPYEQAVVFLKDELYKKFSKKGDEIIARNFSAVDRTQSRLKKIDYPKDWQNAVGADDRGNGTLETPENEYFQDFIRPILELKGDGLPVSAFEADGSVPTGTTKLEKHGMPYSIPRWIVENCIQCNQCSFVCPHACIRPFLLKKTTNRPDGFVTKPALGIKDADFRVQVSAHDCMGCGVCANVCPAKGKALVMTPAVELMPSEGRNWEFAQSLKEEDRADASAFKRESVKGSQFTPPMFEFSYACSGCGETPYVKVLTQLFGEKMTIANATGCSSIYGGSAPTCPYTVNKEGKGPAWANSLFEDNAEFGYGMRLGYDVRGEKDKSVWIIGGDGWAYDIGYGGLDHVLASNEDVNILVLDSEVYSNTGGQLSKATPLGAVARFAASGNGRRKKNLGVMAMAYGNVYVAQVSIGADKQQYLNALVEAEKFKGPSLIIAYSPCIAHGVDMGKSMEEEKLAVESGYWQLYRYNPDKVKENKNPFTLDSREPSYSFKEFLMRENRFASLLKSNPARAEELFSQAEKESKRRVEFYKRLVDFFKAEET